MNDLKNFYEVITDVWKFFKGQYTDYDADRAIVEVEQFSDKYSEKKKYGPRVYDLAMRTIRMWWQEAGEIHEIRMGRPVHGSRE